MEGAALIVHIQDAVTMIGIRCSGSKVAAIAAGLGRVEHIQRMFVDQRRNARDLGKRKQPDKPGSQPTDRPRVRHAPLPRQAEQVRIHHRAAGAPDVLRECRITRVFSIGFAAPGQVSARLAELPSVRGSNRAASPSRFGCLWRADFDR